MAETRSAAVDQTVPDDLISFLKAIPDCRRRRGVRYPQWFLLLVAVLGILSGCRSSRDLEAFARRHRVWRSARPATPPVMTTNAQCSGSCWAGWILRVY
jgi:hypothetical protein